MCDYFVVYIVQQTENIFSIPGNIIFFYVEKICQQTEFIEVVKGTEDALEIV